MRYLLLILGLGLVALGVYLSYHGVRAITILRESGNFSLQVWTNAFWLLDPDDYHKGLGPNGRWALRFFGAFWSFVFGAALVKAAGWMVKR